MGNDDKLSALTRSLILGISLGTVALTTGCVSQGAVTDSATQGSITAGLRADEARLCQRALDTRRADDVNAFLQQYPQSRCVVPLLNSLPNRTLAALSPRALSRVPPATLRRLDADAQAGLPRSARPQGNTSRPTRGRSAPEGGRTVSY